MEAFQRQTFQFVQRRLLRFNDARDVGVNSKTRGIGPRTETGLDFRINSDGHVVGLYRKVYAKTACAAT